MRFGEFLVQKGLVTEADVENALEIQRQTKVHIGLLAVEAGLLSREDNVKLLLEQTKSSSKIGDRSSDLRYGELAVMRGLLTEKQVDDLLHIQKEEKSPLGKILFLTTNLTKYQHAMALREYIGNQEKSGHYPR